jgi:hypothetical protein
MAANVLDRLWSREELVERTSSGNPRAPFFTAIDAYAQAVNSPLCAFDISKLPRSTSKRMRLVDGTAAKKFYIAGFSMREIAETLAWKSGQTQRGLKHQASHEGTVLCLMHINDLSA